MLVKVLKGFPYAHDGINSRELAEGDVENIRDGLVAGLKEEGYVGDPETAADPAAGGDANAAAGPAEDQPPAAEPDGDPVGEAQPKAKRSAAAPKA